MEKPKNVRYAIELPTNGYYGICDLPMEQWHNDKEIRNAIDRMLNIIKGDGGKPDKLQIVITGGLPDN